MGRKYEEIEEKYQLLKKKEAEEKQDMMEKNRSKYSPSQNIGTRKKEITNKGKPPSITLEET